MYAPETILRARQLQGLTQEALAEASGLSIRTIQRIEKGQVRPRAHSLKILSNLLKLDLEQLHNHSAEEPQCTIDWAVLKTVNFWILLSLFIPVLQLLLPWRKLQQSKPNTATKKLGLRLINLQLIWLLGLFVCLLLFPILSKLISGSVAIGKFPYALSIYVVFLLGNLCLAMINAIHFRQQKHPLLDSLPQFF